MGGNEGAARAEGWFGWGMMNQMSPGWLFGLGTDTAYLRHDETEDQLEMTSWMMEDSRASDINYMATNIVRISNSDTEIFRPT